MNFKEFLMKEYKIAEDSAKQYEHRLNGIIDRGIYTGESSITPSMLAALKREYKENSIKNYKLTIERYIIFKRKTGQI